MKILFVSSSYPSSSTDWKSLFIAHIARALANKGIELIIWAPPGDLPLNARYGATPVEARWLGELARSGGIAHQLRNSPMRGYLNAARLLYYLRQVYERNRDVDVIHINWLQNAIALGRTRTPTVVSALGSDLGLMNLPLVNKFLRRSLKTRSAILAPNADWMTARLEANLGHVSKITVVSYGVDQGWYAVTRSLNPTEPRRWLTVLRLTRKKMGKLFEWGESIFNGQDELHLFGPMQEQIRVPDWVHYHGPVRPDELMSTWFPQATGLLTLSEHDEGRPQIIVEAMAAGLPVIASDIPAHRTLVRHGVTGLIVTSREELSLAVHNLATFQSNNDMGLRGREIIRSECGTWDDCADRYIALYRSLTERGDE